jgi:hypothetical protein
MKLGFESRAPETRRAVPEDLRLDLLSIGAARSALAEEVTESR